MRIVVAPDSFKGSLTAAAHALTDVEPDVARCLADPAPVLERLAARVLGRWATTGG